MFTNHEVKYNTSPVQGQDFIWMGEYYDGTHLSEFDFDTKEENDFKFIQRNKLLRFGMVGHTMRLYYEVPGGVFKMNGIMIEVMYVTKDGVEYPLTGRPMMYNDIIAYKEAESKTEMNIYGLVPWRALEKFKICQYNFGYKVRHEFEDGLKFNLKAIVQIPYMQAVTINFRLVCNQEIEGKFVVKRNGKVVDEFDAPLDKELGGELNWLVR